jgi:glycoprotein-N-acetylgalactosamine 3-beta-galactosyltransferase
MSFYFGYIAKTPDRFYPSGGAGYVLSQEALLQFGKQILIKPEQRKLCNTDEAEDINLAYCLARISVFVTNARDDQQLETFHPMTFEQHFLGKFTRWIERNAQFKQKKGEECCSPLTISFHSLTPDEMRMMHFLLYHIQKAPF